MLELIRQGKPKQSRYITTKLNKKNKENKNQNKEKKRKEARILYLKNKAS